MVDCCIFVVLSLTPFCPSLLFTGVCRLEDKTTEVNRQREKRWAFGAKNCVRYFDCWVVSILLFLVSTHLNPLSTTTGGPGQGGTAGLVRRGRVRSPLRDRTPGSSPAAAVPSLRPVGSPQSRPSLFCCGQPRTFFARVRLRTIPPPRPDPCV